MKYNLDQYKRWRKANGYTQLDISQYIYHRTGQPVSDTQISDFERGVLSKRLSEIIEPVYNTLLAKSTIPPALEQDPTDPNYYKFGDVEVIDIARYLTYNGGCAMKYIARSCRQDGLVKADPVEDLKKAICYLQDELHMRETK